VGEGVCGAICNPTILCVSQDRPFRRDDGDKTDPFKKEREEGRSCKHGKGGFKNQKGPHKQTCGPSRELGGRVKKRLMLGEVERGDRHGQGKPPK